MEWRIAVIENFNDRRVKHYTLKHRTYAFVRFVLFFSLLRKTLILQIYTKPTKMICKCVFSCEEKKKQNKFLAEINVCAKCEMLCFFLLLLVFLFNCYIYRRLKARRYWYNHCWINKIFMFTERIFQYLPFILAMNPCISCRCVHISNVITQISKTKPKTKFLM